MPDDVQEGFCIEALESWFLRRFPGSCVTWEKVEQKKQPPDFWLKHDERLYAVEVKSVRHKLDTTVTASQWRLVKKAETEARDADELSGAYMVRFRNPWVNGGQEAKLKRRIRDYVRKNAAMSTTEREVIVAGERQICDIIKLSPDGADIHPVDGGVDTGGWIPDIRSELTEILNKTLLDHRIDWAEKTCDPTILLLHDLYFLADMPTWDACLRDCSQLKKFDRVFVVYGEAGCCDVA